MRENVPVYKIQNMKNSRDTRIVHRKKLLKVDELPLDVFEDIETKGKKKAKDQAKQKEKVKPKEDLKEIEEHLEIEDSEDEDVLVVEKVGRFKEGEPEMALIEDHEVDLETGAENNDEVEPEIQEETSVEDPVSEDDDEDPDSPPIATRKTNRTPIPRSVFTYPDLGGDPVSWIPQT